MSTHLEQLRVSIDEVDEKILQLLAKRLELVLAVGQVKLAQDMKVYDPERERRMLDALAKAAPAPLRGEAVRRIFQCIIRESREAEEASMSVPPSRDADS